MWKKKNSVLDSSHVDIPRNERADSLQPNLLSLCQWTKWKFTSTNIFIALYSSAWKNGRIFGPVVRITSFMLSIQTLVECCTVKLVPAWCSGHESITNQSYSPYTMCTCLLICQSTSFYSRLSTYLWIVRLFLKWPVIKHWAVFLLCWTMFCTDCRCGLHFYCSVKAGRPRIVIDILWELLFELINVKYKNTCYGNAKDRLIKQKLKVVWKFLSLWYEWPMWISSVCMKCKLSEYVYSESQRTCCPAGIWQEPFICWHLDGWREKRTKPNALERSTVAKETAWSHTSSTSSELATAVRVRAISSRQIHFQLLCGSCWGQ